MSASIVGADSEVSRCWSKGYTTFMPDPKDVELLAERNTNRMAKTQPLEGDWVEFADGVVRRISFVWVDGVQTSDGGSWHLSPCGEASFSGSLFGAVKPDTLTDTKRFKPARFWFFHRDWATAHHAVYVEMDVRVWKCSQPATS